MTLAVRVALGLGLGCGITYLATPYAIRAADRLQFYDRPAGYKGHLSPTPYLGGAALMAGVPSALLSRTGSREKTGPPVFSSARLVVGGGIPRPSERSPPLRPSRWLPAGGRSLAG